MSALLDRYAAVRWRAEMSFDPTSPQVRKDVLDAEA